MRSNGLQETAAVHRQQKQVQKPDGRAVNRQAVADERQVAAQREDAQHCHVLHVEGSKDQQRGYEAKGLPAPDHVENFMNAHDYPRCRRRGQRALDLVVALGRCRRLARDEMGLVLTKAFCARVHEHQQDLTRARQQSPS